MKFLLRLLRRRAGRNLNMDKIVREAFATFQLPAAPPTGSRVRSSRTGDVFRRLPASAVPELLTDPEAERILLQWGLWECAATGVGWAWPQLLSQFGPVALLPNDEDQEEARLYGPIGQRWGDPTKPCPHGSCRYGMFHIGPHEEADPMIQDARVLDLPPVRFSGITRDDPDPCNCGRPAAHLPGCPRRARMAGDPQEPSPPADVTLE